MPSYVAPSDSDDNKTDTSNSYTSYYGRDGNDRYNIFPTYLQLNATSQAYLGGGNDTLLWSGLGVSASGIVPIYAEGGAGNDFFRIEDGVGVLFGGSGNDVVETYDGTHLIDGGPGTDALFGHSGGDTIFGGEGNDAFGGSISDASGTITAGAPYPGWFQIYAGGLFGGGGADYLDGGGGDDWVVGGAGNDLGFGGTGRDILDGGTGNDVLFGGDGNDSVYASIGNDSVYGGDGNDFLYGDAGDDVVAGGAGDDDLRGATGVDALFGGSGNDFLLGGTERDYFYIHDGGIIVNEFDALLDFEDTGAGGAVDDYIVMSQSAYDNTLVFDSGIYTWLATSGAGGFHYVAIQGTSAGSILNNIILV